MSALGNFMKNNWFRLAVIVVLLLFCFVYALNNRYMKVSDHFAFDKWTQKGYLIRYDGVFAIDNKK